MFKEGIPAIHKTPSENDQHAWHQRHMRRGLNGIGQYTDNIVTLRYWIDTVTLLRIPLYRYFIKYLFLWLRGAHEVIERAVNTYIV